MKKLHKFKLIFFHPRYWVMWIGILHLWCIVMLLPYSFLYKFGHILGRFSMYFLTYRVNIAQRNLTLCLPQITKENRDILLKKNFESVGMGLIETGIAWFWPNWRIHKLFTITGYENIEQARQAGKGILLIGLHFLTLELGARMLGLLNPGIGVYRPNNNLLLNWIQMKGRLRSNKSMLDRYNLRGMLYALKQKEILWYAPDHDYGACNSVFVPFFSVCDTATTLGTYMLIKGAQPAIIPFIPKRKPNAKGYELIILPDISQELPKNNKKAITIKINQYIEDIIMKAPEQYMWIHRRFKTRPAGKSNFY